MKAEFPKKVEDGRRHDDVRYKSKKGDTGGLFHIWNGNRELRVLVSDGEKWLPVKNFEGLYEVSSSGRVRSLPKKISLPNGGFRNHELHILSPEVMAKGYKRAYLTSGSVRRKVLIHVLVAEAFIKNPNGYPQVNHRNGEKGDNHVMNLEWCTEEYNVHHAIESGLSVGLLTDEIEEIKRLSDNGLNAKEIAEELNRSESAVVRVRAGKERNTSPERPFGYIGDDVFWDHISVSIWQSRRGGRKQKRLTLPSWEDMCFVKDLFFEPEEAVIQIHPPMSQYVNNAEVLHLWRPTQAKLPLPPQILVGLPGVTAGDLKMIGLHQGAQ